MPVIDVSKGLGERDTRHSGLGEIQISNFECRFPLFFAKSNIYKIKDIIFNTNFANYKVSNLLFRVLSNDKNVRNIICSSSSNKYKNTNILIYSNCLIITYLNYIIFRNSAPVNKINVIVVDCELSEAQRTVNSIPSYIVFNTIRTQLSYSKVVFYTYNNLFLNNKLLFYSNNSLIDITSLLLRTYDSVNKYCYIRLNMTMPVYNTTHNILYGTNNINFDISYIFNSNISVSVNRTICSISPMGSQYTLRRICFEGRSRYGLLVGPDIKKPRSKINNMIVSPKWPRF